MSLKHILIVNLQSLGIFLKNASLLGLKPDFDLCLPSSDAISRRSWQLQNQVSSLKGILEIHLCSPYWILLRTLSVVQKILF